MATRPDDQAAGGGSHDQQGRAWDKVIAGCEAVVAAAKGESLTAVEKDMMAKGVGEAINAYRTSQEDRSAHDRKRLTEVAELIKKLLPLLCEMQNSMALHRVELAERSQAEDDDSAADDVSAPSRSASYLRTAIEALSDLQAPMAGAIDVLAQEAAQKGRKPDHRFLMLVHCMAETWAQLLPGQKAGTSSIPDSNDRDGPFVRFIAETVPLLAGYDGVQLGGKVKNALEDLAKSAR
ncbi:hypothetical protein HUE56_19750 [Azospirillum oryzae]|uniref:Uncharacterized protein n=1 Tax=Azospirillum oryzae TaxID=286727 RepID=A0A6N1AM36_9PROT|nr:hypothetical protein [Azospirillum oryzae]KAA0591312.1 hypothetical protein FZ938_04350 [Azospirillum oryzae]QKS52600.1 hypothetical protein HUE56_19750 [Azospirillum oryzae]GLR79797.1 hypothetical protein GCM10007856_24730 [Azospirillum oryzae]